MKLFGRKSPYDIDHPGLTRKPKQEKEHEPLSPEKMAETRRTVLLLIANTFAAVLLYFGCSELNFYPIFFIYLGALIVLSFAYLIYNKGFALRDITPEMLPDSMSPVEKQRMIDDAANRMKRSKWMLLLIIPLVITLMFDIAYLFVFEDLINKIALVGVVELLFP